MVAKRIPTATARSKKSQSKTTVYNEADSVVVAGNNTKDISMADASSSDSEDLNEIEEDDDEITLADRVHALENQSTPLKPTANGLKSANKRASGLSTNGVSGTPLPMTGTLTTILTQALKTHDLPLLETCLSSGSADETTIKQTIQRLDSRLVVGLLEVLAERIARQPNRAPQLTVWVRWTLVCHGAYLIGLPNLVKLLSSLHTTLSTQANGLQRLLALQGRLEMLGAQMEMRRMRLEDDEGEEDEMEEESEGEDIEISSSKGRKQRNRRSSVSTGGVVASEVYIGAKDGDDSDLSDDDDADVEYVEGRDDADSEVIEDAGFIVGDGSDEEEDEEDSEDDDEDEEDDDEDDDEVGETLTDVKPSNGNDSDVDS
ncbi:Dip2/Utp12 family-domain-containing protein [Dipodascopsis tothii]|uniref:Dip2/Utp12 family-domain-containing protein n=1 Tax=Dipodascopsis tothii TaxID=44089 RepID=UPI0034CDA4B4